MSETLLMAAGVLALAVGVAHSWLGERYILIRLFRRDNLPRLFGSDWFTKRTLRFAWHITSVAWWGFGAILVLHAVTANLGLLRERTLQVVALTFLASAVISLSSAKGRHLSWLVFLAIAVLSWLGSGLLTPL